ncbi:hypothetical protein DUNSADRAFT_11035 [Dunaliella salina]|uniref:Uncharacterized protein n=1 Tax=Dunaliella salina TaxID=3046 RepID=A0ABQ7GE87_DUNSA|nr:hypothetical protein DUNSADRAFT_11035 [Dunaliella salina]|eukprot:KAF5832923.1 hypothetical protein DUNSADRAFT_11035 [Dunaliella salina]
MMASLICDFASSLRDSRALRTATLLFSLTRIVVQIGLTKQAPKFLLDAALPAQLVTTLPELLILDPQRGAPLLGYFLCHAGTSAFFYHTVGADGLLASICQGLGMHALCLCAFLAFRQCWKLLCSLGGLNTEDVPKAPELLEQDDQEQHHQEHRQEKEQVQPAENLQHVHAAREQQYSQRQEQKERKHLDKDEQESPGSSALAPHQQLSEPQQPQYVPLSSANLAAAAAAAKAGYRDNAHHKSPCQGGRLHGSKTMGPHEVVAGKERVLEQQQWAHEVVADKQRVLDQQQCLSSSKWECASLARSDTTTSSLTLDSLRSMSRRSSIGSQSSARSNSVNLKASPVMGPASPHAEVLGPKRWVPSDGSMRRPSCQSDGSKAMGLASPPAKAVLAETLSMRRSSSLSQGNALAIGTSMQASTGLASPHAKAVLAGALKARVEGRQPYVSKLHKPPASGSKNSMMQYVQTACRFAVKVNGPSLPGNVPNGAVNQLQQRLSRYQRLVSGEAPAVRAGCLVISYGAFPQQHSLQHSLQDMSKEAERVGRAWAGENGLLLGEDSRLTVQACFESSWCSCSHALPGQPFPPEHSLIVHEPFIEASPPNLEQESFCTFDLTLIAPGGFELRGWHGAADAPEDLPDDVKNRSLSLLGSIDGHFVRTSVQQCSQGGLGERLVQVQVSLPRGVFDASSPLPKVLVLELWASGSLVTSYSAITVPSLFSGALREIHNWVDQASSSREESSAFMDDLVAWMHYQANNATLTGAHDDGSRQQLALEAAAVGLDLLGHSLQHGMSVLAGMLLIGLMSPPFSIPPSDHVNSQAPAAPSVAATPNSGQDRYAAPDHDGASPSELPRTKLTHQKGTQTTTPASQPAPRPANEAGTLSTGDVLLTRLAAATKAVFGAEAASPGEAEYRAWTNPQIARLARTWCMLWVLNMGVGALRMAWTKGVPPLLELSSWGVMLLGYTLGALFIRPGSSSSEGIIAATTLSRIVYGITLGTGIVSIGPTLALVFHYRLEACIEAFMMSVMERVRLSWALPLRALLTISTASFYAELGFHMPLIQSVLVNLCGLGVTAAVEWRDRRLYLSSRGHAKQQALADEGAGQHAASSSSGSGKPKSS